MRYTFNLKKAYDDYYLYGVNTVYGTGEKPRSEYVSPYKENLYIPEHNITKRMCYNKLGQLEDIEEKLGIDLVIFHKALENGVYYKVTDKSSVNYGKIFFDRYVLWGWNQNSDGSYFAMMQSQLQSFDLKDYGKTWALTIEELVE